MKPEQDNFTPEQNGYAPSANPQPTLNGSTPPAEPEEFYDEALVGRMRRAKKASVIMVLLAAASIALAAWLARDIVPRGVEAFKTAYNEAKSRTQDELEQSYYDAGYTEGQSDYARLQSAEIEIGDLREMSELVVLTVSDTEVNIINTDDNKDGIASWAQMTGCADYTVDMTRAEFIVDTARGTVVVRIPKPELGPVTPDYAGKEQLLTANKGANDSVADGTAISEQQSTELKAQIEQALSTNERNDQFAEEEALIVVKNLLLELNPELSSDNVTVEYLP